MSSVKLEIILAKLLVGRNKVVVKVGTIRANMG